MRSRYRKPALFPVGLNRGAVGQWERLKNDNDRNEWAE
jgi:hypothetical protein